MTHATALQPLSPSEVGFLNLESRDPLRYAVLSCRHGKLTYEGLIESRTARGLVTSGSE